jgi:hypothetical protein
MADAWRNVFARRAREGISRQLLPAGFDPIEQPVRGSLVVSRDMKPDRDQILFCICSSG